MRRSVSFGLLSYPLPLQAVGDKSLQQTDLWCDPARLILCPALPCYSNCLISVWAILWRLSVSLGCMTVVCLTPPQYTARQCPQPRELQYHVCFLIQKAQQWCWIKICPAKNRVWFSINSSLFIFLNWCLLNREHCGARWQDVSGRWSWSRGEQHKCSQRERCGAVAGTEARLVFYSRVKVNWLGGSTAKSHLLPLSPHWPCTCTQDHAGPVGKSVGKWPRPDYHTEKQPAVRLAYAAYEIPPQASNFPQKCLTVSFAYACTWAASTLLTSSFFWGLVLP